MDGREETDGVGQDNPLDVVDGPSPPDDNKITLPIEADSGHFLRIRQWGGHLQKGTILYRA